MRKKRNITKKALMSALALSIGAGSSGAIPVNASGDNLFGLKEISSQSILIAEATKAKGANCDEGKCGVSKIKKMLKKVKNKIQKKTTEAKCGEGKCGEGKCGEGKCGSKKKD